MAVTKRKKKATSRDAFVQLRLSTEEKRRFEEAAEWDRRTLSDFARLAMDERRAKLEKTHRASDGETSTRDR